MARAQLRRKNLAGPAAAALLTLTFAVPSALAQGAGDLAGTWLTQAGNAKVKIAPCADAWCGVISWLKSGGNDKNNPDPAKRNRPLTGVQMISGMKKGADGAYAGKIYNPEDGKTYNAKITVSSASALKLSGCVLGGLICKTQTWTRAN